MKLKNEEKKLLLEILKSYQKGLVQMGQAKTASKIGNIYAKISGQRTADK